MALKIYIEGGGDSKNLKARLRKAYRKLLERMDLPRMPGTVACGSRNDAFDKFATACANDDDAMLLVDSEDPVTASTAWQHLASRDGWDPPEDAGDDRAQLMVTCMETWIVADRATLRRVFGSKLRENALPPLQNLEGRSRHDVQNKLEQATAACGRAKRYQKGRRSFQVVGELDPAPLREHLPHFVRFEDALRRLL
jgi:hypothetical protein